MVQRLVPASSRQPHNDVAGFIYAALGVIYAVLLALVVIAVWEQYQAASETVEQEANATAEIFWLGYELPEPEGTHVQELARSYAEEVVHKEWPLMAQGKQPVLEQYRAAKETVEQEANATAEIAWLAHRLPEPRGSHIQELCRSYAEELVHKEWPLMRQGKAPLMTQIRGTPSGWTIIDDIRASLQDYEPRTKSGEQLYAEGLDQIAELNDARRLRLVAAEEGIPGVLWAVLIFGGVAAIGFTYLFGMENTWAHRLMVVTLAAVIGLVLFTIGALEHPFSGGARIGTGAFDLILERFDTSKLSDIR